MNEELFIKAYDVRLSKAYFVKDFNDFKSKYPFLCVGTASTEKDFVKAEARYPSEIK